MNMLDDKETQPSGEGRGDERTVDAAPLPRDAVVGVEGTPHGRGGARPWIVGETPEYLTTEEAARYMRRSVSWMLRRKDIPYYRGRPNVYKRLDLDAWMDRSRRHEMGW